MNKSQKKQSTCWAAMMLGMAVSTPAFSQIDRLQRINGNNPSVSPGENIDVGVQLDGNLLIFSGTNQASGQSELHGADSEGAFLIRPADDSPITDIVEIISHRNGIAIATRNGVFVMADANSQPELVSAIGANRVLSTSSFLYMLGTDNVLRTFDGGSVSELTSSRGSAGVFDCVTQAPSPGTGFPNTIGGDTAFVSASSDSDSVIGLSANGGVITPIEVEGTGRTAPCNAYPFNGRLYYHAFEPAGLNSDQIFSTDGSTVLLQTFNQNAFSPTAGGTQSPSFQEFNGSLIFAANNGASSIFEENYDLFITDGPSDGTRLLRAFGRNTNDITLNTGFEFEGNWFFSVSDDVGDRALWRTNGTTDGTVQVFDIAGNAVINPTSFDIFDNFLYVAANTQLLRTTSVSTPLSSVSGIDEAVSAIYTLDQQLLVAADNDLFTLTAEPNVAIESDVSIAEEGGSVDVQITVMPTVPYEVSVVANTFTPTDNSLSDLAGPGSDFTVVSNRTVTIPANTSQTTTSIVIINDSNLEPTEQFQLVLSNPDGARLVSDTATISITDPIDQPVQAGSISVDDQTVAETQGIVNVRVVTGGVSEVDINFDFAVTANTASLSDFTPTTGSGVIAAGSGSTTFPVTILDDESVEGVEIINVSVTPTSGVNDLSTVTGTITIVDDDQATTPVTPVTPTEPESSSGGGGSIGGLAIVWLILSSMVRGRRPSFV